MTRLTSETPGKETRRVQVHELRKLIDYFGEPPPEVLAFLPPLSVDLVGDVGAGGNVIVDFDQSDVEPLDLSTWIGGRGIAFHVVNDSMLPRYRQGDIVVVAEEGRPVERGDDAVVVIEGESRRCLKTITPGKKPGTYDLKSINRRSPTIRGVRLSFASPVRLMLLPTGIRRPVRKWGRT